MKKKTTIFALAMASGGIFVALLFLYKNSSARFVSDSSKAAKVSQPEQEKILPPTMPPVVYDKSMVSFFLYDDKVFGIRKAWPEKEELVVVYSQQKLSCTAVTGKARANDSYDGIGPDFYTFLSPSPNCPKDGQPSVAFRNTTPDKIRFVEFVPEQTSLDSADEEALNFAISEEDETLQNNCLPKGEVDDLSRTRDAFRVATKTILRPPDKAFDFRLLLLEGFLNRFPGDDDNKFLRAYLRLNSGKMIGLSQAIASKFQTIFFLNGLPYFIMSDAFGLNCGFRSDTLVHLEGTRVIIDDSDDSYAD